MRRFHYLIRDENNKELHTSKKGVAKKGFDNPIDAAKDGDLIMKMKYPGQPCYVYVYQDEQATGKCSVCGKPATRKIGEEFSALDPRSFGHNLTNELCEAHFNMVICPYEDNPLKELRKRIEAIASAAAGKRGVQNDYEYGKHTAAHMILDDLNELFGEGGGKP